MTLERMHLDEWLSLVQSERHYFAELLNAPCIRTPLNELRDNIPTATLTMTIPTSSSTPLGNTNDTADIHMSSEAHPNKQPSEQLRYTPAYFRNQHSPSNMPRGHVMNNHSQAASRPISDDMTIRPQHRPYQTPQPTDQQIHPKLSPRSVRASRSHYPGELPIRTMGETLC